jgi:hypothetical protein
MNKVFAIKAFTIAGATVYILTFAHSVIYWRWYPYLGQATFQDLPMSAGPAMGWYNWIMLGLVAGAIAGAVGLFMPKGLGERIKLSHLTWVVPILLMVYTLVVEWHWFVR